MTDKPDDGLTPPGPPVGGEPPPPYEPVGGGRSVDEWLAERATPEHRNPYGFAPPTTERPELRELDRTSLLAFALAMSWLLSPIGALLGIRGLRRTSDGVRAGRWAAITAIVVGACGTIGLVAGGIGAAWYENNIKAVGRVEVGNCVNVIDDDGVEFAVKQCADPHDAEVVAAGDFDPSTRALFDNANPAQFCARMADESYREAARSGDYVVALVVGNSSPDEPEIGDSYACYYADAGGRPLDDPITAAPAEGTEGDREPS